MSEEKKRKGGGSKLSRSQTVTVRLDPKLRYLAELAARKQRRTLSSFIEWVIENSLKNLHLRETGPGGEFPASVAEDAEWLWDTDESDRFARLAIAYPEMLTHDEQVLWKLIKENGYVWRGKASGGKWAWNIEEKNLVYDRLRKHWKDFHAVARGEADQSALPTSDDTSGLEESDEIPF